MGCIAERWQYEWIAIRSEAPARMSSRLRPLLALASVLWLCWVALPAMACMYTPGPELDQLLSGETWTGQVDGVFEYQQIAWTPSLRFRAERSVSIVTRYWGLPPDQPGLQIHGDHSWLGMHTCPNGSSPLGTLDYSTVNVGQRVWRSSFGGIAVSEGLTPALAVLLEERFGPPVETPVPLTARAAAWFLLLWQPVLFAVVVVACSIWLARRRRQGRRN